ncbi:hypothetical protein MMC16_001696 [Acarospora aff. strigata]|nr:hypothetical protein [Acarospora aff. strigata]
MADQEVDALEALEKEATEFNKDAEIDRILKAFKLDAYASSPLSSPLPGLIAPYPTPSPTPPDQSNPPRPPHSYAVLDLQPGVPESDIKLTYRKKSLLIHPDKTSNPLAPDAFDRLKKAQTELMDTTLRTRLDECIADARMLLLRERKLTVDSAEVKDPSLEFRQAWRKKTVEVLVDSEHRRRKQMRAQLQEEGRAQRKEDEEVEARKRKRDREVAWEESREERIGSWRDFTTGGRKGAEGVGGGGGGGGAGKEGGKKKKKMKPIG